MRNNDRQVTLTQTADIAAEQPAPTAQKAQNFWQRGWQNVCGRCRTTGRFVRELFHEHEFWVQTLAVKGGASAIVIGTMVAVSYVVALPFFVAAAGIAACGGVLALGAYGIVAGGKNAWHKLREIHARVTGGPPPVAAVSKAQGPTRLQKMQKALMEKPFVQKLLARPLTQKFLKSRVWKLTQKITHQDSILGGIAIGGAAVTLAIGATLLVTQVLVLPVVAVSSLLTVTVVTGATYVASGISGLYFGIRGVMHQRRRRRAERAAAQGNNDDVDSAPADDTGATPETPALSAAAATESFNAAQKQDKAIPALPPASPATAPKPPVGPF